ncbi:matrixin family metalloprotease [Aquipuribacter sp. SD81]|uniref:matrixin family metalloprotease n=1 Tax=Aquipuribacter sp. SD81 TaxID=3127703 RepID=UPI003016E1E6
MTWDDLPRSPSGRVPQWVLDEAARRSTVGSPTPQWEPQRPPPEPRRRVRWRAFAPWLVVVAILGAAWPLSQRAEDGPRATAADSDGGRPAQFAYLDEGTDLSGRPYVVAWSPCAPIRYVVNPEGAPDDFESAVREVLDEVTAASGLTFSYEGTTTETAAERGLNADRASFLAGVDPVLFAVADADSVPDLADDVAGLASTVMSPGRDGRYRYSSGRVVLDRDVVDVPHLPWQEPVYVSVLRHEAGHLVGLDHVDDHSQVMYRETNDARQFQAGDLAGLAELGRGTCA